jgi:S1-C subfamily serine protease
MQPQQKSSRSGFGSADQSGAIVCGQCGAPMPTGMRFCRSCGNRLGEGPAEYTETVKLPNASTAANAQFNTQYAAGMGGGMARQTGGYPTRRRRLGFSGMTWLWIVLGLFFASGGLLSSLRLRAPRSGARPAAIFSSTRSYLGVEQLKTTEGGVTFDLVAPPDSPADKAGLVGGDIITSFDGHAVASEGQMMDLLEQTPVGKTVEVVYLRDGLTKKTLMTTISEAAFNQLKEVFDNRPEGKGIFGFERDRTTRISSPETKTYGVRIDWVDPNGPADLFGIKEGDIITDFDKTPIRTSDELLSRVRRAKPKSVVDVGVLRDGQALKIPMTMGRGRR